MVEIVTTTDADDTFNKVLSRMDDQAAKGLAVIGKWMIGYAEDSMPFKEGSAPKNKPPHSHTGTLRSSLTWGVDGKGGIVFGTMSSVVGERGAWLEFGGRPLEPGQKGKPRKRKLLPHPFIRPTQQAALDKFASAVAGTFGSSQ